MSVRSAGGSSGGVERTRTSFGVAVRYSVSREEAADSLGRLEPGPFDVWPLALASAAVGARVERVGYSGAFVVRHGEEEHTERCG